MKYARALAGLAACCILSEAASGPVEDAIVSAMLLSEQPSYSWLATVTDDARTYEIAGKTSHAGYTQVRMPIINSVRRRLGRSPTDSIVDAIFRGNVRCVLDTNEGWMTVDELPVTVDPEPISGSRAVMSHGSIFSGPLGGRGGRTKILNGPRNETAGPDRGYSNLQLGISHPHEELGVIVSTGTDLEVEGNTLSGNLSGLGAQLLLVRDGQESITPVEAAGSFMVWFRDGVVSRYQVRLEGLLAIRTGVTTRQIRVRQTTSTMIKDVGSTQVDVPFEAKVKLDE